MELLDELHVYDKKIELILVPVDDRDYYHMIYHPKDHIYKTIIGLLNEVKTVIDFKEDISAIFHSGCKESDGSNIYTINSEKEYIEVTKNGYNKAIELIDKIPALVEKDFKGEE